MKDRVSRYPGRVQLSPVSGQPNTYDLTLADNPTEAGTALNKASLLKDATAALFGLTNAAVPDDVLAWLGKYAKYWWKRRSANKTIYQGLFTYRERIVNGSSSSSTVTVYYSQTVRINQVSGAVELVNPQQISGTAYDFEYRIVGLAPCYFYTSDNSNICYLPQGSTAAYDDDDYTVYRDDYKIYLAESSAPAPIKAKHVFADWSYGAWDFVSSNNRNAYPDSGISGGYEYEYLGVPFDNLPAAPKFETGSYVGTGTYGASNPNSLQFSFPPKLVIMLNIFSSTNSNGDAESRRFAMSPDMLTTEYISDAGFCEDTWGLDAFGKKSSDGKTIYWYNATGSSSSVKPTAETQCNESGQTYYYIAIG